MCMLCGLVCVCVCVWMLYGKQSGEKILKIIMCDKKYSLYCEKDGLVN